MAVISMDATDHSAGRGSPFDIPKVRLPLVETDQPKNPTPLGYHILRAMQGAGYTKFAPFARDADISGSTLHRLVFNATGRPDPETLLHVARLLARKSEPGESEPAATEAIYRELMGIAGFTPGDQPAARAIDPTALKVDHAIGEDSPLSTDDRDLLRTMINRLIDDALTRRRKRAG